MLTSIGIMHFVIYSFIHICCYHNKCQVNHLKHKDKIASRITSMEESNMEVAHQYFTCMACYFIELFFLAWGKYRSCAHHCSHTSISKLTVRIESGWRMFQRARKDEGPTQSNNQLLQLVIGIIATYDFWSWPKKMYSQWIIAGSHGPNGNLWILEIYITQIKNFHICMMYI